jgi:hypothetical protein
MNDNLPYTLGGLFGSYVVFPLIIFGIGYGLFRLIKKRKPTNKEKIILISIALVITVVAKIGAAAKRSSWL